MTLRTKLLTLMAALMASKHAIASATVTTLAAATLSATDPIIWFFSGSGAVVAHLKMTEKLRRVAIANGIISVILGGLGGPYINAMLAKYEFPQLHIYLAAFLLAVAWPFISSKAVELWDKKVAS